MCKYATHNIKISTARSICSRKPVDPPATTQALYSPERHTGDLRGEVIRFWEEGASAERCCSASRWGVKRGNMLRASLALNTFEDCPKPTPDHAQRGHAVKWVHFCSPLWCKIGAHLCRQTFGQDFHDRHVRRGGHPGHATRSVNGVAFANS